MNVLLLILLSVLCGSLGQVILKLGANNLAETHSSFLHYLLEVLKLPEIWAGLFLFGMSFLIWIKVLTKAELSFAYPLVSLSYIVVVVLSYFIFHESITVLKVIGIAFILIGAICLNS